MLVINYNGNKPVGKNYKYSVQYNNNADIVRLVFLATPKLKELFGSELENGTFYVKCQCVDDDYYDRIIVDNPTFDEDENAYYVDFVLKAQQTCHDYIDFSLSIENDADEIVWQTQIVRIDILNGIDADEQIADKYPSIIQYLLNHVGGGSGDHDVKIERVWLKYNRTPKYVFAGKLIKFEEGESPIYNDASKISICFKTTPISDRDVLEIKNGRFVIRFDYPVRHKRPIYYKNYGSQNPPCIFYSRDKARHSFGGSGYRSFAPNFLHKEGTQEKFYQKLYETLVFVNESDIKTNAYGEKYIYKTISYVDLVNSFYRFKHNGNDIVLTSALDSQDIERISAFEDEFTIGCVPWLEKIHNFHSFSNTEDFSTTKSIKGFKTKHQYLKTGTKGQKAITKIDAPFTIYSPFKLYGFDESNVHEFYAYTPLCLTRKPYIVFNDKDSDRLRISYDVKNQSFKSERRKYNSKYGIIAVKPRCCILDTDNIQTNGGNVWLKKYSQSDQNIRIACKEIVDRKYPVFRIFITKK